MTLSIALEISFEYFSGRLTRKFKCGVYIGKLNKVAKVIMNDVARDFLIFTEF